MESVFVTGGTGLLGGNLIEELLQRKVRVVALVRDTTRYVGTADDKNLELVEGDLLGDWTSYMQPVDYVIHIAALTAQNYLTYAAYHDVNVEATLHLYRCANRANVKRFLFVSSANTVGYGNRKSLGTELTVVRFPFTHSFYAQSKKSAEEHLLSNEKDTEVCFVNPTFMLGALDSKPSSGQIITRALGKRIIFFPPGGKNFVHVRDVVDGILRVLTTGNRDEKYLIANLNMSYLEFYKQVLKTTGQNSILLTVPAWILNIVGLLGNVLNWMGFAVNFSSINVKMLCINNFFSNRKSVEELGMTYRSIDEAIQDAVEWWRDHSE